MTEICAATDDDAAAIRKVHLNAFDTSLEADLVEQLVRDGHAVVSLVAKDDKAIVGHVLFSRMEAEADGRMIDALGLAPVAVLPARQHAGIGGKLIESGLREARLRGAGIVFVLGEPGYYGRFGFSAETAGPFASPYAGEYFQAKLLQEGMAVPTSGRADYAAAFAGLE